VILGYWENIATDICVGAKNDDYKVIKYSGPSRFITKMKLVQKKGQIGCADGYASNWGCISALHTGIIVTGMKETTVSGNLKIQTALNLTTTVVIFTTSQKFNG
jgi:homoaconitase/3-isopropylmalate dehydratase large subunit